MRIASFILATVMQAGSVFGAEFPVGESSSFYFVGHDAHVKIVGTRGDMLKISGIAEGSEYGNYEINKNGNRFEVSVRVPEGFQEYQAWSKAQRAPAVIEIALPPMSSEFQIRSGKVELSGITKPLMVSMIRGKIDVKDSSGALKVFLQSGELTVNKFNGELDADMFQVQAHLRKFDGDFSGRSFLGQTTIEESKGDVRLTNYSAALKVDNYSGNLRFDNQKGVISVQDYSGRIDGSMRDGVFVLGDKINNADVNVSSGTGKLQANSKALGGALVHLTALGQSEILLPGDLKAAKVALGRSLHRRLAGEARGVQITFKTQDGAILLK